MRSRYFSTGPAATLSSVAFSTVSSPVVGCVRTTPTTLPSERRSRASGVNNAKS
jgi:hypothetical protein